MKSRTYRRLGAWTRTPLSTVSGVVGIAGFVATVLVGIYGANERAWIYLTASTMLASVAVVRIAIALDTVNAPYFFSPISFEELTGAQYSEVLTQIAQGDSATPQFASVAPIPDELALVLERLTADRVAYVIGSPGEGKSTLAYHVALALYPDGYSSYELQGPALTGYSREYILSALLTQADGLQGDLRLIIVDDAQLLERPDDVREVLLKCIEDFDTYLLWVSTDYLEVSGNREPKDLSIRISYPSLAAKQATFFRDNFGDIAFRSSPMALNEAIDMSAAGIIKTAWQYSFVAFEGSQRLVGGLASLSNFELFVIFEISGRAVATGSLNVPLPRAQSVLVGASTGWVVDDSKDTSYRQALLDLSHRSMSREQFLRIDNSDDSSATVACLHYAFAREVVRRSIERAAIAADLVESLASIIAGLDGGQARYLAPLLRDVRLYIGSFVSRSESYLRQYIYSQAEGPLSSASEVIKVLVQCKEEPVVRDFIGSLNAKRIADRIDLASSEEIPASASALRYLEPTNHLHHDILINLHINKLSAACSDYPIQFQGVANLIRELGSRRAEMLEHLNIVKLAEAATSARPTPFQGIADLIRELGPRRAEMLEHLNIVKLAEAATSARPTQFPSIADLIRELGPRRAEMLEHLDIIKLADTAGFAQPSELRCIAELLRHMGSRRDQLVDNLSMQAIALTVMRGEPSDFGSIALFLQSLGSRRNRLISYVHTQALIDKASNAHASDLRHAAELLWTLGGSHRSAFDATIIPNLNLRKLGLTISQASAMELGQAASLLRRFGRSRAVVIQHIDLTQVANNVSKAQPAEFTSVASFIRELGKHGRQLVSKLDVIQLASTASAAHPGEFSSVAFFGRELGERREEFVSALNVISLARSAGTSHSGEFTSTADLLILLSGRGAEFLHALNIEKLAETASYAPARSLRDIAVLIPLLGESNRNFIDALDFTKLAQTAAQAQEADLRGVADLSRSLGERRVEFADACRTAKCR